MRKNITRKEELILLSIHNLKDKAYLIGIASHLAKITRRKVSLTSVHLPLSRLEEQGFIDSQLGDATAVRGGRRKKIYSITPLGYEMLDEQKRISDMLWKGYPHPSAPANRKGSPR